MKRKKLWKAAVTKKSNKLKLKQKLTLFSIPYIMIEKKIWFELFIIGKEVIFSIKWAVDDLFHKREHWDICY